MAPEQFIFCWRPVAGRGKTHKPCTAINIFTGFSRQEICHIKADLRIIFFQYFNLAFRPPHTACCQFQFNRFCSTGIFTPVWKQDGDLGANDWIVFFYKFDFPKHPWGAAFPLWLDCSTKPQLLGLRHAIKGRS